MGSSSFEFEARLLDTVPEEAKESLDPRRLDLSDAAVEHPPCSPSLEPRRLFAGVAAAEEAWDTAAEAEVFEPRREDSPGGGRASAALSARASRASDA